jgi:hypothetical protein
MARLGEARNDHKGHKGCHPFCEILFDGAKLRSIYESSKYFGTFFVVLSKNIIFAL